MTVAAGHFVAIGAAPPGASVTVCSVGTSTPVALYTDQINGVAAANPVAADGLGTVAFYAVAGDVDLLWDVGDTARRTTVTVQPHPTNAWPG